MAAYWDKSDVGTVELLVRMVDQAVESPGNGALLGQIRLYKDSLGLSLEGRRKLRWLLPGEVPPDLTLTVINGGKAPESNVRRIRAVDAG